AAGTLSEVLVEEGKTVGINTVVARIDEGSGNGAKPGAAAQPAAPAPPRETPKAEPPAQETITPAPAPQAADETEPPAAARTAAPAEHSGPLSPLVRKLARENNIDLSRVKGTGAGGRITKQDVEGYLAQQHAPEPAKLAAPPSAPPQPVAQPAAPPAPVQ